MKSWQVMGLLTLVVLLAAGGYLAYVFHVRNEPGVQKAQYQEPPVTDDQVVQPRKMYIATLNDAKDLTGKTVWVQAGFSMEYYPYVAGRVEFAHPISVLPSVQALAIEKIVEAKVPPNLATRVPAGDKQVLAVFRMPGDAKEYATAIGTIQGTDETYYADQMFYYDDPHLLYKHWPADVWQAVDDHKPKPGMNELQVAMALGTMQQSDSRDIGNRTVTYDAGGKKWSVSFAKDKATTVTPE